MGSILKHSIVYRSCFKVTWKVSDEESFIERQYISVSSHRGGEMNTTTKVFYFFKRCKICFEMIILLLMINLSLASEMIYIKNSLKDLRKDPRYKLTDTTNELKK